MNNPEITIEELSPTPEWQFNIMVTGPNGSMSRHVVRVPVSYLKELKWETDEISVKDLLRRSFTFLLAREPKESILSEFTLSDIERYFPEYREAIRYPRRR